MAGRVEGKVAFITGAARGQGRSHAVRLAQEGADIIAVDICEQIDVGAVPVARPRPTWPRRSSRSRRSTGGSSPPRPTSATTPALKAALDDGVAAARAGSTSCRANAGIFSFAARPTRCDEQTWDDMIDINLTGVWHTVKAAIPHLIEQGTRRLDRDHQLDGRPEGHSRTSAHYIAAKHGVVGLMRTLALELAPHMIRVNTRPPDRGRHRHDP